MFSIGVFIVIIRILCNLSWCLFLVLRQIEEKCVCSRTDRRAGHGGHDPLNRANFHKILHFFHMEIHIMLKNLFFKRYPQTLCRDDPVQYRKLEPPLP